MAPNILHFGGEIGDRFPFLRNFGYSVNRYGTVIAFRDALESGVEHDALSLSDQDEDASPLVVLAARALSSAPLILFRTRSLIAFPEGEEEVADAQTQTEAEFDLVVPASASPRAWIGEVAALIASSRALRHQSHRIVKQSEQLRQEIETLREKTRYEMQRGKLECARNSAADASWTTHLDRVLRCANCGMEFVFTVGEQLFFQKRNFLNDPKHCRKCRADHRNGVPWERSQTTTSCARCGVSTKVPFKPTQGRPVLCRPCLEVQEHWPIRLPSRHRSRHSA
jgi:CxxC-x17-CxxC domain-containing protein